MARMAPDGTDKTRRQAFACLTSTALSLPELHLNGMSGDRPSVGPPCNHGRGEASRRPGQASFQLMGRAEFSRRHECLDATWEPGGAAQSLPLQAQHQSLRYSCVPLSRLFSLLSSALIVHVDIRTSNLDSPRRGRLLGRLWGREAGLEVRMAVEAPGELSQIWRHAPTDPRGNERHAHVTGRSISHGGLGFQPERPRFGGDASRRWSGRPSLASRVVGLCIKTGRRVGASTWMSVQNPPPRAGSLVSTSAGRAGVTANPQRPWRRPVWSGVRG